VLGTNKDEYIKNLFKTCFLRMPSKMLQIEIQLLLVKVVRVLVFGMRTTKAYTVPYCLFWRFSPVAKQRMGLGPIFPIALPKFSNGPIHT